MINVTVNDRKENEYPKLMGSVSTGLVVLFNKRSCGTCVYGDNEHKVGDYREDWIMENFVDYNFELTLQNA